MNTVARTQVFRVEHPTTQEGPFVTAWMITNESVRKVIEKLAVMDNDLPQPFADFGLSKKRGIPYCMKFGCLSVAQLKLWFIDPVKDTSVTEFIKGLSDTGFAIAVYEVNTDEITLSKSNKQVMYDYAFTKLVKHLPLNQLLKGK